MRLWHQNLIPQLPRQQLLGQWRECIALLGNGWGRKHKTVDYVFQHPESYLMAYSKKVYDEMTKRGYYPNLDRVQMALRKRLTYAEIEEQWNLMYQIIAKKPKNRIIYPEHNDSYYRECLENLRLKGIEIEGGE